MMKYDEIIFLYEMVDLAFLHMYGPSTAASACEAQ